MTIFLTGIAISILHVVSGPDHLAAVSPLAAENGKKSWKIGLFWGIGHTVGVLILGFLFFLFREILPIEKISIHTEKIVGITILLIGIWAIFRQLKKNKTPYHHRLYKITFSAITMVGIIHGFAGFSHIVGILPTLSLTSFYEAFIYLLGFTFGTVFSMLGYAFIIGLVGQQLLFKKIWNSTFCLALGSLSVAIGIYWIIL